MSVLCFIEEKSNSKLALGDDDEDELTRFGKTSLTASGTLSQVP